MIRGFEAVNKSAPQFLMILRLSEEQWLNTFGNIFRVEIFGESHGPALGCTLDGLPAGFQPDLEDIVFELSRRRPRQSIESTARREADSFEILSGFSAADLRECR